MSAPPEEDPASDADDPQGSRRRNCRPIGAPQLAQGPTAATTVVDGGAREAPRVEAVVYPRPDYEGAPWSHWGQGVVLDDGRFWSAIGDHLGVDGNSYLYSFDPGSSRLTQFGDVLSNVEHQDGAWGYGKIHGQLVQGPCGEVWAATYWGTRRGLEFAHGYVGDRLLRIDPVTHVVEDVGAPVPLHGIPSLAGSAQEGLLYGEAVEPETDEGRFFVFDMVSGDLLVDEVVDGHTGYRNILVDADGAAHIAVRGGRLAVYDPGDDELQDAGVDLPGDWLRAATAPAPDGTVYGVTRDPDAFFALDPTGVVRDLGRARGYVASMALHPDGEGFLYVPDAHGGSWKQGTPLIHVDGDTGEDEVLIELHDPVADALSLRLGGTYSITVDHDRRTVYVVMNAGEAGEESFGEVVLVIVGLP